MSGRLLVRAAALVLLVGCSGGSGEQSPPAAPSPGVEADPARGTTVVEATYADGEVTGVDPRVPVVLGEQVVLRVTSDVVEQIHVHGYDVHLDLVPGQTVQAELVADKPGSWEVELHRAGRPLFQLRVS